MRFLVSVILVFECMTCLSQTEENYSFGFRAGINYANIGGPISITNSNTGSLSSLESKFGFYLGAFSYSKINSLFQYGAELQFTTQGAQASGIKFDFNYLTAGFIIKCNPFKNNFNIHLGPQFGYLVSGNIANLDNIKNLNRAELSAILGVGYALNRHFELNFRYCYGFSSTFKKDSLNETFPNRVFQFGFNYTL
jgi:hypothetical protein